MIIYNCKEVKHRWAKNERKSKKRELAQARDRTADSRGNVFSRAGKLNTSSK